jgi:hypothetical protein
MVRNGDIPHGLWLVFVMSQAFIETNGKIMIDKIFSHLLL